ncbi:MAG: ribonuclease III [Bacteroidales bacterium]|nr:ribonuclease III [Bacteroidales bacterium]
MLGLLSTPDKHDKKVATFLKNILGIRPRNLEVYCTALVHRSASGEKVDGHCINNERLEYLGDAILDAIMAEFLFKKYPLKPEGELTEMRSKLVSRERLGQLAFKLHLLDLITINPNAHAKSAGGDAFEALVGALFLDRGYEKTKQIVLKRIFATYYNLDEVVMEESNFKSKILNWAQRNHKKVTFDHVVAEQKRSSRLYKARLLINGEVMSEGLEYTVKKAEQIAAERACEKIFTNEEKS